MVAVAARAPARLAPPPLRPGQVERPDLLARLDGVVSRPLTVVRAPTGYGKTMLLARWTETAPAPCAWATLSAAERAPSRLWPLVAAAGAETLHDPAVRLRLQHVAATRSSAAQLRVLVEALAALEDGLVLVLDDLDAAGPAVDRALQRLLERMPPTIHVVLSTRRAPQLDLPVRRAHGELLELGDDDLAFTVDEAEALLDAPRADVAALVERLEGWPAGLHLAAHAAGAAERPLDALRAFSGVSRLVADYLRHELLDAQRDEARRQFLLRTSVLHRLTPAAVEALLGSSGAGALLEEIAAGDGFLTPAGDGGHRYRRPAREFLQRELLRTAPEAVPVLRRRAAAACERSGFVDEAIAQARATGDGRGAAAIARRHALELARAGRIGMLEHLVPARRTAVVDELRRLQSAAAPAELAAAAERVARVAAELPAGQVRTLVRETAAAERAYALLLLGRYEEARAGATVVELGPPSAARAQLAAVGALAAVRLGLYAAAAPLVRAARSAATGAGAREGRAAALVDVADGAVALTADAAGRARQSLAAAAARDDAGARALALALLAAASDGAEARALLAASRRAAGGLADAPLLVALAGAGAPDRPAEAAELSPAELRVLRLFASRLTQREIARELYLSPNTVKTHARVIYRKLGVDGRAPAVRAARELNLV
jgi:LuxR family maltose regulon positive regulatory protein